MSTTLLGAAERALFETAYVLSPIFLTGGLAASIAGGTLPIVVLTEGVAGLTGLLTGSVPTSSDDFFAHFISVPGSTLIDNQIGAYPFANQTVAANAIIADPLAVSLLMVCPPKATSAYLTKLATLTALQAALASHNNLGGTYTVVTPGYVYTNAILLNVRDVTEEAAVLPQSRFQFDFVQPLVSQTDAAGAQGSLMSKLTGGQPTGGAWSGVGGGSGLGSLIGSL